MKKIANVFVQLRLCAGVCMQLQITQQAIAAQDLHFCHHGGNCIKVYNSFIMTTLFVPLLNSRLTFIYISFLTDFYLFALLSFPDGLLSVVPSLKYSDSV